jgi:hypothetical protein
VLYADQLAHGIERLEDWIRDPVYA